MINGRQTPNSHRHDVSIPTPREPAGEPQAAALISRAGRPTAILVIETAAVDAERLRATLRVLFGYQVPIVWASSLADALARLGETKPELAFLGDLGSQADAPSAIGVLRRAGFAGPIIAVSNTVTPALRIRTITDGAIDVIHKDDLHSARIAEALQRARVQSSAPRGG